MATTYAEKLRDPRWQKRRLEIMERDGFSCQHCGSTTSTLNVHHTAYSKRTDPWDYPASRLLTLCEECHETAEERRESLLVAFGLLPAHAQEFVVDAAGMALCSQHGRPYTPAPGFASVCATMAMQAEAFAK